LSEAKWQLDGREADGVTGASQRASGATDACRRANEAVLAHGHHSRRVSAERGNATLL